MDKVRRTEIDSLLVFIKVTCNIDIESRAIGQPDFPVSVKVVGDLKVQLAQEIFLFRFFPGENVGIFTCG